MDCDSISFSNLNDSESPCLYQIGTCIICESVLLSYELVFDIINSYLGFIFYEISDLPFMDYGLATYWVLVAGWYYFLLYSDLKSQSGEYFEVWGYAICTLSLVWYI